MNTTLRLENRPNLRGGGGGGFGGAVSFVDPGDYTVIMKVGDSEQRQTVKVVKP